MFGHWPFEEVALVIFEVWLILVAGEISSGLRSFMLVRSRTPGHSLPATKAQQFLFLWLPPDKPCCYHLQHPHIRIPHHHQNSRTVCYPENIMSSIFYTPSMKYIFHLFLNSSYIKTWITMIDTDRQYQTEIIRILNPIKGKSE